MYLRVQSQSQGNGFGSNLRALIRICQALQWPTWHLLYGDEGRAYQGALGKVPRLPVLSPCVCCRLPGTRFGPSSSGNKAEAAIPWTQDPCPQSRAVLAFLSAWELHPSALCPGPPLPVQTVPLGTWGRTTLSVHPRKLTSSSPSVKEGPLYITVPRRRRG